jgi:hypothetical protein
MFWSFLYHVTTYYFSLSLFWKLTLEIHRPKIHKPKIKHKINHSEKCSNS